MVRPPPPNLTRQSCPFFRFPPRTKSRWSFRLARPVGTPTLDSAALGASSAAQATMQALGQPIALRVWRERRTRTRTPPRHARIAPVDITPARLRQHACTALLDTTTTTTTRQPRATARKGYVRLARTLCLDRTAARSATLGRPTPTITQPLNARCVKLADTAHLAARLATSVQLGRPISTVTLPQTALLARLGRTVKLLGRQSAKPAIRDPCNPTRAKLSAQSAGLAHLTTDLRCAWTVRLVKCKAIPAGHRVLIAQRVSTMVVALRLVQLVRQDQCRTQQARKHARLARPGTSMTDRKSALPVQPGTFRQHQTRHPAMPVRLARLTTDLRCARTVRLVKCKAPKVKRRVLSVRAEPLTTARTHV